MSQNGGSRPPMQVAGAVSIWGIVAALGVITALHLLTGTDSVGSHMLFRRLYYVPIILAAFAAGLRGGVGVALAASALYFPHAFLMEHHLDPAPTGEKILEMVLYLTVGVLTGALVERSRRYAEAARNADERIARLESLVRLSSGLAHEVRNPLAAIHGALEVLADDYPQGDPKRPIVQVGLAEASRLDGVLTDFLDFANPRPPARVPVDLRVVAERVCGSASLARPEVAVRTSLPTDEVWVEGDADQLMQATLNLALNAVHWSPPDQEVVLVVQGGLTPAIHVLDRGPGVPEEERERIFDPYVTHRPGGSGLGLSVAGRLADANHARVDVGAGELGGARFSVCFDAPAPRPSALAQPAAGVAE